LDAYLQIAESILKIERRPLSARAILAAAYRRGLIPMHLHGNTQQKTLGARISEDIITLRDDSLFFRTAPGRFFLREFLTDVTIPEEHRQPVATRRRIRDLMRGPALAVDLHDLQRIATTGTAIPPVIVFNLLRSDRYRYDDPKNRKEGSVFLWSFVSVRRNYEILSYRLGRYRDDRDMFMARRSVGFSTLVHRDERTLFNLDDFGIVDSGVHATKIDLDVPEVQSTGQVDRVAASLVHFIWVFQNTGESDLLAVINFECPKWFEPERRRLALNDLSWFDIRTPVNDVDDFDPWSRSVLWPSRFTTKDS
jgi:hypothetical protein